MRQMEHAYLACGFGSGRRTDYYGDDDFAGGSAETVEEDLRGYLAKVERSEAAGSLRLAGYVLHRAQTEADRIGEPSHGDCSRTTISITAPTWPARQHVRGHGVGPRGTEP